MKTGVPVSKADFDLGIRNTEYNNKDYRILHKGSIRVLYLNNEPILEEKFEDIDFGIHKKYFFSFLGQFNKEFYKNMSKMDFVIPEIPEPLYTKYKNRPVWEKINIGDRFIGFDMESCFWQMCYKLGYIGEKLYLEYINYHDYKIAKRLCVTFLARRRKIIHKIKGIDVLEISCDNKLGVLAYQNVMNLAANILIECGNEIENEFIDINTDCIIALPEHNEKIKNIFKKYDIRYCKTHCMKINDYQYYAGKKVKNFTRPPEGELPTHSKS